MVLSMLVAIIAAPGLLGSQEAIRQSQSQEKREEHRARRCNLIATCVKSSLRSREINGRPIVLRNGKLWIDAGTEDGAPLGHPYAGYYLPYPDSKYEGLVTTITDEAPIMNWIYIDKETHEVKYGVRLDAQPNLTGPFDCTRQDRRLTFDGWEGFCAVEGQPGLWALYFDVSDDGLKSKVAPGTRVLEIELSRKEKRFQKEAGKRMQDQTTKRAVNVKEDAPVDQALGPEALVSRPGVVGESVKAGEMNEALEARGEDAKPKPFSIPKSISENPPAMLKNSVFERPLTPPPAYERSERPRTPDAPSPPSLSQEETQDVAEIPIEKSDDVTQVEEKRSELGENFSAPSRTPPNRSVSPAYIQLKPSSEKRATPKLNRSSGTRTLARAQMFEAMAAEQKPSCPVRHSSKIRGSRASSASEYSHNSQDVSEENAIAIEMGMLPAASPTPAPLVLAASKSNVSTKRAEISRISEFTTPTNPPQRPRTPPHQRALTDPGDPAVFGAGTRRGPGAREPVRRPSISTPKFMPRPSTSRSSSQTSTQSLRAPLQRGGTAPDQAASNTSPRVSSQAKIPTTRSSLASTMTTGRGNRGMTTRLGGAEERGRPGRVAPMQGGGRTVAGRKTTSALFREIDELVSQDVGVGNQIHDT